jgi:hypothetical protein
MAIRSAEGKSEFPVGGMGEDERLSAIPSRVTGFADVEIILLQCRVSENAYTTAGKTPGPERLLRNRDKWAIRGAKQRFSILQRLERVRNELTVRRSLR